MTTLLTNPIVEKISILLIFFISLCFVLWLTSKVLKFKKQDFKVAFRIAAIVSLISFLIRFITNKLLMSKIDSYTITETALLLVLIKKMYELKWPKTFLTWFIAIIGKWVIVGFLTLIIFFITGS